MIASCRQAISSKHFSTRASPSSASQVRQADPRPCTQRHGHARRSSQAFASVIRCNDAQQALGRNGRRYGRRRGGVALDAPDGGHRRVENEHTPDDEGQREHRAEGEVALEQAQDSLGDFNRHDVTLRKATACKGDRHAMTVACLTRCDRGQSASRAQCAYGCSLLQDLSANLEARAPAWKSGAADHQPEYRRPPNKAVRPFRVQACNFHARSGD